MGADQATALLDEITRRILSVSDPERIIVFGSYARGEQRPDSDVDLLVIEEGVQETRRECDRLRQALRELLVPLDIIVATPQEIERYGEAVGLIYRPALREGRVLYERSSGAPQPVKNALGQWSRKGADEMSGPQPPDAPQAWLRRARSDLLIGRAVLDLPGALLEDACFHAQQCAEKALKALLVDRGVDVPRTHVLALLLDLVKAAGVDLPPEADAAVVLTHYAVQTRYPGLWQPVTQEEARRAIDIADAVLALVGPRLTAAP